MKSTAKHNKKSKEQGARNKDWEQIDGKRTTKRDKSGKVKAESKGALYPIRSAQRLTPNSCVIDLKSVKSTAKHNKKSKEQGARNKDWEQIDAKRTTERDKSLKAKAESKGALYAQRKTINVIICKILVIWLG